MTSSGEQVLIVESDPDISDLIGRQALQPLGYKVTVTGGAGAAIKLAIENHPDLILANLNLPGLSGKDLIAALTSQGITAPLVVIAEKGQEQSVIQSFRLGAVDAILWPARDAEVVRVVERALQQTRETRTRFKTRPSIGSRQPGTPAQSPRTDRPSLHWKSCDIHYRSAPIVRPNR